MADIKNKNAYSTYLYNRLAKPYVDSGYSDAPLPQGEHNNIMNNALDFFYLKDTNGYFSNFKGFWTNWTEDMPDYFASELDLTIGRARTSNFDKTEFIPKSQSYNRSFEQNVVTNFQRKAESTVTEDIVRTAFGGAQTFAAFLNNVRKSLEGGMNTDLYYNILNYLLFSDAKITSDVILPNFISLISQDATPKKIITSTQTTLNNTSFSELMKHVRLMCTAMQTNYNIGDPLFTSSTTSANYAYAHGKADIKDFIMIMPESLYNQYMTNVDNTKGLPNIYNFKLVDLNAFFENVENNVYDDVSAKISIEVPGSTDNNYNTNKIIDNPFQNQKNILVIHKDAVMVKSRIKKAGSQYFLPNTTFYNVLHMWLNVAVRLTQQGFIFKFKS